MRKICCIFNTAPHYREEIYKLMDERLSCDFYIGDNVATPLEKMDYKALSGYKKTLKNKYLTSKIYWQKGALAILFSKYTDIILSGEYYCLSTLLILLLARIFNKKTYIWTHGVYGDETGWKKLYKHFYLHLPNKILLYGNYAQKLLLQNGYNQHRLYCIHNSLNYTEQKKLREQLKLTDIYKRHFHNDNPVIIFIGRIQFVKRIDLLFDAIALLNKENIKFNVIIVGKDIENVNLPAIARNKNIENQIWLYGPCFENEKIAELFFNADICVSPGNVGLTSINAFSYGCPVITHDNFSNQMPEFEVITPPKTGDFFSENDPKDLALTIKNYYTYLKSNKDSIKKECFKTIDTHWNPEYQLSVLQKALYE